jgi:hypothetical protein
MQDEPSDYWMMIHMQCHIPGGHKQTTLGISQSQFSRSNIPLLSHNSESIEN